MLGHARPCIYKQVDSFVVRTLYCVTGDWVYCKAYAFDQLRNLETDIQAQLVRFRLHQVVGVADSKSSNLRGSVSKAHFKKVASRIVNRRFSRDRFEFDDKCNI